MGKKEVDRQKYLTSQAHQVRANLKIDLASLRYNCLDKRSLASELWSEFGSKIQVFLSQHQDEHLGKIACTSPPPPGSWVARSQWEKPGVEIVTLVASVAIVFSLADIMWEEKQQESRRTEAVRIKCRFCDKTFAKYRTGKDGKPQSGFAALMGHVADDHPEQADKIVDFAYGSAESED